MSATNVVAQTLDKVGAHGTAAKVATGATPATAVAVRQLLDRGLLHLYAAHHQGAAQAKENGTLAASDELRAALHDGVQANFDQAARLEKVFAAVGLTRTSTTDAAMAGIIDDNQSANAAAAGPLARDLTMIASGQLAAHFYVARYGTLAAYARLLGHAAAAVLLEQTLAETNAIDAKFTTLAQHLIVQAG